MNESIKIIGASVLGLAAGAAVGYKIAEKRLGAEFEERLERETAGMKEFYSNVKQPYSSPEEAVADLIKETEEPPKVEDPRVKAQKVQYNKIVKGAGYDASMDEFEKTEAEAAEVIHKNVFNDEQGPKDPYVIGEDTFMANEDGFEQETVTYYENGKQYVDTHDKIIDKAEQIFGPNPPNFGDRSNDPNLVYIRNENLRMDYEVVRSERSYEEDVLGQEPG